MTESARELLEDIKTGDSVRIRYGTDSDQIMVTGTVLKWSDHVLSLERDDGKISKIRLDDSLRALEPLDESDISNQATAGTREIVKVSYSGEPEFRVLRQLETLPPAQPYIFALDDEIGKVKQGLKSSKNTGLKRSMNGVLDSLNAAVKSREISYKYHNLRAKLHQTWYLCKSNADYEIFYEMLGILAIVAGDYEYSLEPLVRANRFLLAAYASSMGNLTESAQVFSLCALFNEETVEINQYISESLIARNDVDSLKEILEKNKNNDALCEKLASCAYAIFKAAEGKMSSDITPYDKAYDVAKQLLDSVPQEWNRKITSAVSYWQVFKKYTYALNRTKEGQEIILTGKIKMFNPTEKWGFITPNNYFYVEQIYDSSEQGILLRKMLSLGLWNQLEVSFRLGESGKKLGQSAATAIELTDRGYQESQQRIEKAAETKQVQKGFVEVFFPEYLSGRIQSNGKNYNFKLDAVADPWLRAYYRESFSTKEQDVYFEIVDKKAVNIYWRNFSEDERSEFDDIVTENEKSDWSNFLTKKTEDSDEFSLPERDPYENYHYVSLAEWTSDDRNENAHPLTWGGKTIVGRFKDISVQEILHENIIEKSAGNTKKKSMEDGRLYAERARKASLEGDFETAEANFENALVCGGFNEAVVCDYIFL